VAAALPDPPVYDPSECLPPTHFSPSTCATEPESPAAVHVIALVESHSTYNIHVGTNNKPRAHSIQFTAISASGGHFVIVTKREFRVFNTLPAPSVIAMGTAKGWKYQYGTEEDNLYLQFAPPDEGIDFSAFSSVALSDEYLAIAANRKVMIFKTSGREGEAGRLLVCDTIPNGSVTGLTFSADGSRLVSLWSGNWSNPSEAARIYPTSEFVPSTERSEVKTSQHMMHIEEVLWPGSYIYKPRCMAFSWKGDMVAIATNHVSGTAQITILKLAHGKWFCWGTILIKVVNPGWPQKMRGDGVTGISLYISPQSWILVNHSFQNDECLVLSLESSHPDVPDCFQIIHEGPRFRLQPRTRIATGKGTSNVAIAVSQRYAAMALLSKEGIHL